MDIIETELFRIDSFWTKETNVFTLHQPAFSCIFREWDLTLAKMALTVTGRAYAISEIVFEDLKSQSLLSQPAILYSRLSQSTLTAKHIYII